MKGWFRVIEEQTEGREQSSGVQLRGREVSSVEMLGSTQQIFGLDLVDHSRKTEMWYIIFMTRLCVPHTYLLQFTSG